MSRVVVVLPSIHEPFTQACLASLSPDIIDVATLAQVSGYQRDASVVIGNGKQWTDGYPDVRMIVVYNTPTHNLGCSGSWNLGVDEVLRTGADWLWILSAGVRFGRTGGKDFLRWLDEFHEVRPDVLGVEAGNDLGWHLIAFPRHVLEKVGRFDEVFSPAYKEDLDYSRRIQLAYGIDSQAPDFVGPLWPKVETDAKLAEVAHGIIRGGVTIDFQRLEDLYVEKWGAPSPGECWEHPYNDASLDYTFTGQYLGPKVSA